MKRATRIRKGEKPADRQGAVSTKKQRPRATASKQARAPAPTGGNDGAAAKKRRTAGEAGTGTATRATGKPTSARRPLGGSARVAPSRRMTSKEIVSLFERLSATNPEPTTELEYSTPYELLVAVALSAQMTDVGVNKATRRLFAVANTPAAIARLGVDGLSPYLTTINFHRTKARNVVAMARQLIDLHDGEVPRDRESLEALPGVGRKTANVVLNTAFGETALAVDTHIFRVSNRTGLAPGADVREVEDELVRVVPPRFLRHAHHWLLLHGRYVCKARTPDCPRCIVRDLCHFPDKTPGAAPPLEVPMPSGHRRRPR